MGKQPRGGTGSTYVEGALVLGLAAMVSKLIGTLQKIPLQNIAGDGVFGIYNAVYPFYILFVFLATAGFPVAISKFVAERMAVGDEAGARRILRLSVVMLAIAGLCGFLLLYGGAEHVAGWMGNMQTVEAIRSCSYALLVVPVMSAVRGYFQGKANMVPTAVSQVAEQFVRVATMLVLLWLLTSRGASEGMVAAGATFGSAAGGIAGLLVMLYYYRKERRGRGALVSDLVVQDTKGPPSLSIRSQSSSQMAWQLVRYAVLVCLGAIAVPMLSIVDTFTVPNILASMSRTELEAMTEFGIYNRGLPLVQLVGMIVSSISVTIIPAITQAQHTGSFSQVREQIAVMLRWFWLIACAGTLGLVLLAEPINIALYQDAAGTATMMWVSCMTLGSTMNIVTGAMLQGLGKVNAPAYHLFVAIAVKIALNLWLVPSLGMNGAAIAGVAAYSCAAILNMVVLYRTLQLRLSWKEFVIHPGLLMAVMAAAVGIILFGLPWLFNVLGIPSGRTSALLVTLIGVMIGVTTLMFSAMKFGVIRAEELRSIPKFAKYIPKLQQIGWLKK
ncbi:hypothetical protein BVG16_30020 [Paenibacillus selenitireducens]|uniref:Uncharacterized protein n=1 Tax=Paenibacillus selenitireducens TaxID=1324314 RepID=A0A1T2WZY8_9BACL|nr:polysaccharide biosynthesis protein [Paenibacillus selenitireducens]OPA73187.1 hypothetical protein BVG16_30020 [Paenibacillus selenitireducens]